MKNSNIQENQAKSKNQKSKIKKKEQDPIDDAQKFSLKIDENQNGGKINNDQKEKTADFICDTIPEEKLDENGQFSDPKSAEQEAECLSILKSTEWHTVQIPNEEHKNLMIRVSGIFGFRTSFSHLPRKPES
uniref:Uncharacterized protein n=1 Tax=Romanomermis culicivorax TaxID=13658 RepID=A0A915L060_ROMCU